MLFAHFLLERRSQGGDDLEQVADHAVARQLEDGRFRVLVDGNDHFAGAHAGQVLDRAGNAEGDIYIRRDNFTGLPHLVSVGNVAAIHRGARGANGCPQRRGQVFDQRETLLGAPDFGLFFIQTGRWCEGRVVRDAAPAGDDHIRIRQADADLRWWCSLLLWWGNRRWQQEPW